MLVYNISLILGATACRDGSAFIARRKRRFAIRRIPRRFAASMVCVSPKVVLRWAINAFAIKYAFLFFILNVGFNQPISRAELAHKPVSA